MLGLPGPGPPIVPARQRAPSSEAPSAGKSAPSDGAGGNAAGADGTARMLGKCRLKSGGDDVNRDDLDDDDSDDSADSYDSGDSERLDMLDELVGATGVQYTERAASKPSLVYLTTRGIRGEVSTSGAETRIARASELATGTDSRGADSPMCHSNRAYAPIALVQPLGTAREASIVAGRVSKSVHAPARDTSRRLVPLQWATWRRGVLLLSAGYATLAPTCTWCSGMMILVETFSRSCILGCSSRGLRTCRVQCRRPTPQGTNGHWTPRRTD